MLQDEKNNLNSSALNDLPAHQAAVIESILFEKNSKIVSLENEVRWLKEQFKLAQQRQFGRSSEKNLENQVEIIFDEEFSKESQEVSEVAEETEEIQYVRRKAKQCGRKLDTSKLPRERQLHDLAEHEKVCACGCALEKIGEDVSEQIDYIPAQLKVIEHVRLKYNCRHCETIQTAVKPESPLSKSMATANFITDVILKKYEQHLPLYRQSKILAGQGFEIPDNTLGNWVMGAAEVLEPLKIAAWSQVPKVKVLQADETPVKILKPDKKGYMWAYHSCSPHNRFILFEFSLTRSANNVNDRLIDYQGFLQTDGYSGYNTQRNRSDVVHFGCWDHARRKFAEVVKISGHNKSGKAGEMLVLMAKLYEVETKAKVQHASAEERKQLRQQEAKPILDLMNSKLQKINAPPQSALGKAVAYTLNQWSYLSKYIDYGEVEISNCWIENQIRPFALGRKNWLFVGNEVSANRSALLYSLIQTCKLNKIDPRKYLVCVLNQAHKMRRKEIDPVKLLPQFIDKQLLS